jgi:formylglycine-generating enzyme required for sulfatase activity
LMGRNPSKFQGPDRPVERPSYLAAVQYCNMRSLRENLTPCYDLETLECDFTADGYRLPTEAEWEYACRAGTTTPWSFGNDPGELADHAWFRDNAGKTTHPVRQKRPNPWGLYDMYGNVAEWCHDRYDDGYYERGATQDPRGPDSGDERVLRGGHWASSPQACRSSARNSEAPGFADVCFGYELYGFRCVRNAGSDTVMVGKQPVRSDGKIAKGAN